MYAEVSLSVQNSLAAWQPGSPHLVMQMQATARDLRGRLCSSLNGETRSERLKPFSLTDRQNRWELGAHGHQWRASQLAGSCVRDLCPNGTFPSDEGFDWARLGSLAPPR